MRSRWLKPILIASSLSLLAALGAFLWWQVPWLSSPTYGLKLAGGIMDADGQKFFSAFVREAAEEYPRVRFKLFPVEGSDGAGRALMDGSADLAVLRSDDPVAGQAPTIIILRKLTAAFLVDANSEIEAPRDLATKKVGVLDSAKDDRLIKAIADFYGYKSENIIAIPLADVGKAITQKRVAGMIVLGSLNDGPLKETIGAIRKATKNEPSLLDMEEAEAFVKRYPLYETGEILKGALRAAPPEPSDDINTVMVTTRLVSRTSFPSQPAGELTRVILGTKAKLLSSMPAVAQIEAPATDGVSLLPLHPGTASYLKGEQKGLYEYANENFYNAILLGGFVFSGVAWIFRRVRKAPPDANEAALTRLAELRRRVTTGGMQYNEIESELAEISGILADQMIAQNLEPNQYLASSAVIEQLRGQVRATARS